MLQTIKKTTKNQKGFTLVELMVVIAIIGILAAIAVPRFTSANETARGAKMQADLRTIDSAIALAIAQGTYVAGTGAAGAGTAMTATTPAGVVANLSSVPLSPAGNWRTPTRNAAGQVVAAGFYSINDQDRAVVTTTGTAAGNYDASTL